MADTPGVDTPFSPSTPTPIRDARQAPVAPSEMPATKEERLARLAVVQQRRDNAAKELGRLHTVMEDAFDEDELAASMEQLRKEPDSFLESRRPIFRKAAAAVKEEQEAAVLVASIEQEIRDHSMSPADMLVEVRSLIRKQNAAFEAMAAENAGLVERVATLEAVVKALVSLPQIAQSVPDVCAFATSEVNHEALQVLPNTRTIFHHATQEQLTPVVDYVPARDRTHGRLLCVSNLLT